MHWDLQSPELNELFLCELATSGVLYGHGQAPNTKPKFELIYGLIQVYLEDVRCALRTHMLLWFGGVFCVSVRSVGFVLSLLFPYLPPVWLF